MAQSKFRPRRPSHPSPYRKYEHHNAKTSDCRGTLCSPRTFIQIFRHAFALRLVRSLNFITCVKFWLIPFYSQRTGKQASISILPAAFSLNMGPRSLCRSSGGLVLFRIAIPPLKYCLIAYFPLILPCARWPRSRLRSSGDIFL